MLADDVAAAGAWTKRLCGEVADVDGNSGNVSIQRPTCATSRPTADAEQRSATSLRRKKSAWWSVSMSPATVGSRVRSSRAVTSGARNAECYTVPEVYWVQLR
jgi:hypothetical protein